MVGDAADLQNSCFRRACSPAKRHFEEHDGCVADRLSDIILGFEDSSLAELETSWVFQPPIP